MNFEDDHDARVRSAAFDWLTEQVSVYGDVLPRRLLAEGFRFEQRRVPLVGPQGIFKPAVMEIPLSITTSPGGPYDDAIGGDNLLSYRYRGTDPSHRDNRGLRFALQNNLPLAYFHGLVPGRYLAWWPVYVVQDTPEELSFSIALDNAIHSNLFTLSGQGSTELATVRREYAVSIARRRLHQRAFRERVLRAYQNQCAFCRLRHTELLDAAHIIPDSEPDGEPVVTNGISLCRLHHAAFDRYFLAVRPDHTIEVRADILEESDGPTLRHAIQGLHDTRILLPSGLNDRPSREFLARRYDRFRELASSK